MEHHHDTAAHKMVEAESSGIEYVKFGGIILAITAVSWLVNDGGLSEYLGWFMGVFFVVFAGFKLLGYQMFALMFSGYDIVAERFRIYAYAYPFIELALGLVYLFDVLPGIREVITIIIMGLGSIGVIREIRKRSGVHCACLGNIIKLPLSTVSLVEDVGMGLMAVAMLLI